uniref:Amino acid transporter transmembrane domain-containing protein n=1 Tax=Oryza meridionalis TaxID=40149 RepID=A0A0E0C9N7_9ORYZ
MTPPASTGKCAGAGEVEEPLLPEFSGSGHGASVCGAVFNVSTSIIGAGIMSIPAAMRVLGVLPALLLIAAVAALSDSSVDFMLRYTGWDSGPPSYAGIMGDAFGRAGAKALNVCIAFTTTGTLVVYLIIIGDVLSGSAGAGDEHAGVLQELFGAQWWTARELVILVTAVVVLLPLVLRRRVAKKKDKALAATMIALAVITSSIAIASNVMSSISGKVEGGHAAAR